MSAIYGMRKRKPRPHPCAWFVFNMLLISMAHLILAGCSSWQVPPQADDANLRDRSVTEVVKGVRIRAAVLSSEDSLQMFGVNISETGVQPVWVEVENTTQQLLWLLRSGTDPDIFSPLEVAWSFHETFSGETNTRLDDHFDAMGFQNPIAPGTTQSGIIFTNPHQQTKFLNVDILGEEQIFPFTLFPPVPDETPDRQVIAIVERFAAAVAEDYQEIETFRARLEQLPCCSTNADGTETGDPVNAIIIGEFADIVAALVRRGFRRLELDVDNVQRLFGRIPDAVARKAGQGGVPANWLRMWLAPFHYQGQPVFLVQTGRPVGGRFKAPDSEALILHPNVDEARNILVQDMLYSGGLGKLAYISGVSVASPEAPRSSLDDTSYYTDGLRAVMFFQARPLALSDIEIIDWEPYLQQRESAALKENAHGNTEN